MRRDVYIWEFEVPEENRHEFLRHYGPTGTWAQLFRGAAGYMETILLQDQNSTTRYLTVDRWASSEAHDAFLEENKDQYHSIDRLCESVTQAERSLGSYWEAEPSSSAA